MAEDVASQTQCPIMGALNWSHREILTYRPRKLSHCRVQFQIATSQPRGKRPNRRTVVVDWGLF